MGVIRHVRPHRSHAPVAGADAETDRAHMGTKEGPVEQGILSLVEIRASQLNGCAICLDMHIKQARLHGERELRLHHVAIGRESSLFSDRERAAPEWTEALPRWGGCGGHDAINPKARAQLSDTKKN